MPIQQKDTTWFDGYFGHKAVLIEEMRSGMIPKKGSFKLEVKLV
jgi:hypothetical protein